MKSKSSIPSPSNRPSFIKRTEDHQKKELTRDSVQDRQNIAPISTKYPQIRLVFDISGGNFVEVEFTDLDHADPWKLITERVNQFLTFVNKDESIKKSFKNKLTSHFSDDFIIDKNDEICVTDYLLMRLYNDPTNLFVLNSADNTSKNSDDFAHWVKKPKHEALKELLKQVADPQSELDDLLDRSGFIVKFKNTAPVKENYQNKGIAEVLCLLMEGTKDDFDSAMHSIKNAKLLNAFRYIKLTLENRSSIDEKKINQLQEIIDGFKKQRAKGCGTQALRARYKEKFWKIFEEDKDDEDLALYEHPSLEPSSEEISDDERTIMWKATVKELEDKNAASDARANDEKARADNEKARADAQHARANDFEAKYNELKRKLETSSENPAINEQNKKQKLKVENT